MNNITEVYGEESISIEAINPPAVWRRISEAHVVVLMQSMRTNGQLQPIGLEHAKEPGRYDLRWGEHRRLAGKKLGWKNIRAVVLRDLSPAEANLVTLDENLARNGYTCVLEEAMARAKQKELYEQLHPETSWGGVRHQDESSNPKNSDLIPPFTQYVANASNQSRDRIELLVKIGRRLTPYADMLFGTSVEDKLTELLALSRTEGDVLPLIELIQSGSVSTVADAKKAIGAVAVKASDNQASDAAEDPTELSESGDQEKLAQDNTPSTNAESTKTDVEQIVEPTLGIRVKEIEERLSALENIPGYLANVMKEFGEDTKSDYPTDLDLWYLLWSAKELKMLLDSVFHSHRDFKCPRCESTHLFAMNLKCTSCEVVFWAGWEVEKK